MLQLILHGIGDYYLQTDFQALNKKKPDWFGFWACLKHCLTYTACFIPIATGPQLAFIFGTHFFIDRTNIVAYALALKNRVYKWKYGQGNYVASVGELDKKILDISNFGFGKERPFAITIWLYIICDNLLHIICNYIALKYL